MTPSDRLREDRPQAEDGPPDLNAPSGVSPAVRLLVVEDSDLDYELLLHALRRQGFDPDCERVETAEAFEEALSRGHWDAVISDHHLPRFSSTQALSLVRSGGSRLPFIIISGAIGEEVAVQAMQAGADDYLIKGKLARLGPALRKAMAAAATRNEREQARKALADSERRLRELADHLQLALEAERAAIAREVHDDVGGMLTALRFDLNWIERHAQGAVQARARQGLETLEQAVAAVQRLLRNLRPPALDAGLVAALEALVEQFASRTGLRARLRSNREHLDLSEAAAITVYRVAQESLTNVAKHARARQV
ncbi:MAG: response regulator, partial [Burkholderiaceae bacterium]